MNAAPNTPGPINNTKITSQHLLKKAYVYIRQSTMGQVLHHQESTSRQYALREKALHWGWNENQIRVLDRDLGQSGSQSHKREDFRTLLADVSLGEVGAVLALEASRLARSNTDWHRLIELCSLTNTLLIDEDGCYDPADFNDALLLGLKGTMSAAELHFLRGRLQGGKRNKAERGELRFPLPVGLAWHDGRQIVLDPDAEIQGAVRLIFRLFRQTGSAYGVAQRFAEQGLKFPKRAYGGAWNGKLIWGHLTDSRVLSILKNPAYAGVYVFGRFRCVKHILQDGEIRQRVQRMPRNSWLVEIQNHHDGYVTWEEYLANQDQLQCNLTQRPETVLGGAAREGLALLQGLLICGSCGRRLTVRYRGNGGIYPLYECNWLKRQGRTKRSCLSLQCPVMDQAVASRVLEVLNAPNLELALASHDELEKRDESVTRQWQMRLERVQYEADLANRRYEEVDPINRLVAAALEQRWNEALQRVEDVQQQMQEFQSRQSRTFTDEQRQRIQALVGDFPQLWKSSSTSAKDRKRILRLLLEDITVGPNEEPTQVLLHIRWTGGAYEDLPVPRPPKIADRLRYSADIIDRVRCLAAEYTDSDIAARLHEAGQRSARGKPFTASMVSWIRHKYDIAAPEKRRAGESSVPQIARKFNVSQGVVYYWIDRGIIAARQDKPNQPYWITLAPEQESELNQWVQNSTRIKSPNIPNAP
jgi:DNA invertase Pin-like site-specific DNA recombinase